MVSCSYVQRRQTRGIIAEIDGQTLSEETLRQMTAGLDSVDSARVAEQTIQQWAIDILQYKKASGNNSKEIEQMVEDYRRSLYLYEYEQRLVARHMPKEVADTLITTFYQAHKENFILNESIMKGILVVFPIGTPKQDKLRQWLANPDEENLEKIEKYTYQYATGYELFLTEWKTANQIILRLPTETDILQQQLHRHSLIEVQDSVSCYWLQVTDKHFAGDYMPQDYAAADIKQIILAQRQVSFLREEREKLYRDAVRFRKIKLYNPTDTNE